MDKTLRSELTNILRASKDLSIMNRTMTTEQQQGYGRL